MLRYLDSFYYANSQRFLGRWKPSGAAMEIASGQGRFGNALSNSGDGGQTARKTFDPQAFWFMGHATRFGSSGSSGTAIAFLDGTTIQVEIRKTAANQLAAYRNGTLLATGSRVIVPNVVYYLELGAEIDNAGQLELRIDGVTDILFSGDTQDTANAYADTIGFGALGAGQQIYISDLYVCDSQGSLNSDFLGDIRVEPRYPDDNGNSSDFVGSDSDSTDNYLLVDEAEANDDTDYVQAPNVGDKDTYEFEDLVTTSGEVFGVQSAMYARKTDAGGRSICSVARLSATEDDSDDFGLSTSYQFVIDMREEKPGGGVWTITDVNSAEFGPKVTA